MMRRKKGWMKLRVKEIIHETHDTDTFILVDDEDDNRPFDYFAGQYLTFRFDDVTPKPIVRSYTMSSSPNQKDAAFTVKRVENGVISNWLCDQVKAGDILKARGPIGKFCFFPEEDQKLLYMVAGGSGVTPFISVIREFAGTEHATQLKLLVSHRTAQDLIGGAELVELSKHHNVEIVTSLTREKSSSFEHGRIDETMLAKHFSNASSATWMTCGPQAIMDHVVAFCAKQKVPEAQVKTESFD